MATEFLRRYIELPALIYLLTERKLTLLDPASWDDSNDSHFLDLYRQKKKLSCVLAACFTHAVESYHHWRVFADGPGGVCVRFNRQKLLKALKKRADIRTRAVEYLTIAELEDREPLPIKDLPFLKRYAFEPEDEFRVIFESYERDRRPLHIDIPLSCIDLITLSPWLNYSHFKVVSALIHTIPGCGGIKIVRSTLIGNQQWKQAGEVAE